MINAIVTDIEGTTTDIAFVKNVLFPYARAAMAEFVAANASDSAVAAELTAVREHEQNPAMTQDDIIATLIRWIDEDQKIGPLKSLQGMIWKSGYETGAFTGHVYDDVPPKLRAWHAAGIKLYVYSSGSVAAQKLLFGHSDAGDLTPLFTDYFDTKVGGKRDYASYQAIQAAIGLPAKEILFLTDIVEEADAARAIGFKTVLLNRYNLIKDGNNHRFAKSFDAVDVGRNLDDADVP